MVVAALAPLRRRKYALVWSAALVSNIGTWMQTVAVGVLVTARTGAPAWTGLVAAAAFVPIGLLSPLGGAMADRVDRRRWLIATTVGEAVFATALTALVATGRASPPVVTLLVLGGGAMGAIGFPAYQALLPDLVGEGELLAAVSLSSAQFNLGRVVGPALAGVVIVAGGYSWAFAVNALSFLAVVAALLAVRVPRLAPVAPEPVLRRLVAGARATVGQADCRWAVTTISLVALTASPFIALVPAMALQVWHDGAAGTSLLVSAQGAGAVLGALSAAPLASRLGARRLIGLDVAVVCGALAGYAAAPGIGEAAAALLVVGAAYVQLLAGLNTTVQLNAPDGYRGRVLGVYMMALGLLYPAGAVAQGAIGGAAGLREVTVGGAALLAVISLARSLAHRRAAAGDGVAGAVEAA